ncbi:MAG: ATP-binding protein [Vulcanimicrobiota bacterium]
MRTLIMMNDDEARRGIIRLLRGHFNADISMCITDIELQFDLCILDETALKKFGGTIRSLKERDMPQSLLFLLVVSREHCAQFEEYIGDMVDEILFTPVDPFEFKMRIETLSRIHRLTCESEQNYYSLMISSPIGMVLVKDGSIIYNNKAFARLFGIEPSAMVHSSFIDLFHLHERELLAGFCHERYGMQGEIHQIEATMLTGYGERVVDLYIACTVYKGEEAMLVNVIDVTEQKRLREQMHQAQKMEAVGKLAGGIAHDFNNALSVILCYSSLVLEQLDKKKVIRDDIVQIVKAAERASSLTRQLLTFSRKRALQIKKIDMNELVRNMQKLLKCIIGEDIALKTLLEPNLRPIMADPGQMEQVIMNLVINSRDAMPEGGTITLSTESRWITELNQGDVMPGVYLCLSIRDTGIGMDEKTIKHIFDPFYTTKDEGLGTGLGLSIVYAIVTQHKGFMNVESRVGEGSAFNIHLPFSADNVSVNSDISTSRVDDPKHCENFRILYIEDEEMVALCSSRILRQEGYIVYKARTAKEAQEIFIRENGEFHVVFTDVVLPDKTGPKLIEDLRAINPDIKVVFSSGYAEEKAQHSLIKNEEYGFLHKPYCGSELLTMIRNAVL